jgi:hypothetical protein
VNYLVDTRYCRIFGHNAICATAESIVQARAVCAG